MTSARNVTFLMLDSIRNTCKSGRRILRGKPGNPPPEPRRRADHVPKVRHRRHTYSRKNDDKVSPAGHEWPSGLPFHSRSAKCLYTVEFEGLGRHRQGV